MVMREVSINGYIDSVRAAGGFWSAYRQGYLAALLCHPKTSNPFSSPHSYHFDWLDGYSDANEDAGLTR